MTVGEDYSFTLYFILHFKVQFDKSPVKIEEYAGNLLTVTITHVHILRVTAYILTDAPFKKQSITIFNKT